ncbi:unnamed protein product [Symbiodinium natans]|uniref:Uncharacterized protein n=1 Tax=Symbiodinium natans TaxID=878477 RepID=A0A812J7V0_9DINO|nr:unnamed protein product [Symbiodinium natans]
MGSWPFEEPRTCKQERKRMPLMPNNKNYDPEHTSMGFQRKIRLDLKQALIFDCKLNQEVDIWNSTREVLGICSLELLWRSYEFVRGSSSIGNRASSVVFCRQWLACWMRL